MTAERKIDVYMFTSLKHDRNFEQILSSSRHIVLNSNIPKETNLIHFKMNAFFFFPIFFATLCLGQISTPEVDVSEPGLYLTTAGYDARVVRSLGLREVICMKDFPTGFSIRCVGESTYATFYVDNVRGLRERSEPFYINGNVSGGRVRAWTPPGRVNRIKCVLRGNRVYKSRISYLDC